MIQKMIRGYQGRKLAKEKKKNLKLMLNQHKEGIMEEDVKIQTFKLPKKYQFSRDSAYYPSVRQKLLEAGREDILAEIDKSMEK